MLPNMSIFLTKILVVVLKEGLSLELPSSSTSLELDPIADTNMIYDFQKVFLL